MAFRGKIHHRAWRVLGEQALDQRLIGDIALHKGVTRIAGQLGQTLTVAGIGQFVEVEHRLVAHAQPVEDEIRADKAGAAGYEDHSRPFRCRQHACKTRTPSTAGPQLL